MNACGFSVLPGGSIGLSLKNGFLVGLSKSKGGSPPTSCGNDAVTML